MTNTAYWLK